MAEQNLHFVAGAEGTRIYRAASESFLIRAALSWPMCPEINGKLVPWIFEKSEKTPEGTVILLNSSQPGPVKGIRILAKSSRGMLDLSCEFVAEEECELNALQIFPEGTGVNLYDAVNFRNRHFASATWPELLIGQEISTTTYSDDWQFAPHPTAMVLRKNDVSLFAGALGLQSSFGMRLELRQSVVKRWDIDFGQTGSGLKLAKGRIFKSAAVRFFLGEGLTPYEMFARFGEMLVGEKLIPDPAKKKTYDWWKEPVYCTWGDQWMKGKKVPAVSLADQASESAASAKDSLTEDFLWSAVEIIQKEKLPVRTIILDEGWERARGDWRPHQKHFPDLRRVVDRLHGMGFKVMVWWNWAEIAKEAEVDGKYLVENGKWLNKHGARWRDYSDPCVQNEYLSPLFRTLFGRDADCFDLDGVKTDFLADKVHARTPVFDPEWRGEEQYFRKVTELFCREMRKHKEDALHMGCAGNYWIAEFMGLNRTYDVHSSNWLEHEERAKMLACTSPGVTVSYDMMTCSENTERWFASAKKMNAGVQIGNVLYERPDSFTAVRPASEAYLKMLKENLDG